MNAGSVGKPATTGKRWSRIGKSDGQAFQNAVPVALTEMAHMSHRRFRSHSKIRAKRSRVVQPSKLPVLQQVIAGRGRGGNIGSQHRHDHVWSFAVVLNSRHHNDGTTLETRRTGKIARAHSTGFRHARPSPRPA